MKLNAVRAGRVTIASLMAIIIDVLPRALVRFCRDARIVFEQEFRVAVSRMQAGVLVVAQAAYPRLDVRVGVVAVFQECVDDPRDLFADLLVKSNRSPQTILEVPAG